MEHIGMTRIFESLEDTGLKGFLEGTTSVFENVVTEFFVNAKVIAGTIVSSVCNRKLVITEDVFSTTFRLPTEGMTGFLDIPKDTVMEMHSRISATDVPFKTTRKKREMKVEYHLLHDIIAKSLCAKAGSFDTVTSEKFELMMDHIGQNEVASTTAQDGPRMFTDGCPEVETFEIADWVDNRTKKETNNIERALYDLIAPSDKGKGKLEEVARPNHVEEQRQIVLHSAWDDVCARMDTFDEWMHFRKEPTEPSVNHDYMCIRFLSKELREIAGLHRAQRILVGLPIEAPEASIVGDDVGSNTLQLTSSSISQSQIPALEFSTQKEQEQAINRKLAQQDERIEEIFRTVENVDGTETDSEQGNWILMNSIWIKAQGEQEHVQLNSLTEKQVQLGSGSDPTLIVDPSVYLVDTVQDPESHTIFNEHDTDHQGLSPSNLRMSPSSPHDNSKLVEMDKPVASIDSRMMYMESNLTSLDSRTLSIDLKMHSMESKLCSMGSHIEQLMDTQTSLKLDFGRHKHIVYDKVNQLAGNVTSSQTALETSIICQLAGQQHQLTTDLDMVKLQLAELVEHFKRVGDAKKGEWPE
ncbi:hypothetical protein F511_34992 [Dorcoceras hygrometricum]|uniref:Uncharacterized protein n=1 Tax=Dorcoceras hygrometricum TaxID=472368 RepID=A0A2Z7AZ11_9LAMI|nr:hypothetical protein F511_34992 [Dorcoceras hygrometricum]